MNDVAIGPPCILIVEPDILVRHPLAEYLRECGYRVSEATDATEARQVLSANSLSVDIVLADVNGSQGQGFTLSTWIRSHHPEIKVVLASSVENTTVKAGTLCHQGPATSKPLDHRHVLDKIRRLRAGRDKDGFRA